MPEFKKDPVCHMSVDPKKAKWHLEYKGADYFFCREACYQEFKKNPEAYLDRKIGESHKEKPENYQTLYGCPMDPEIQDSKPGFCSICGMALEPLLNSSEIILFTCPMHPEIIQEGPGSCPICGMALVPKTPSLEGESSEEKDLRKKFWIGFFLTLPILFLSMKEMIPFLNVPINETLNGWLQLILSTIVIFYCGGIFFERGFNSFKTRNLNMFSLISLGVLAAYLFSVFSLFFPELLPQVSKHPSIPFYFETGAVIIVLVLFGQFLEAKSRGQTRKALSLLLQKRPVTAQVIREGKIIEVPVSEVLVGDKLNVRPGDKVPVDGEVLSGASAVDESLFTGEPLPVDKKEKDKVIGGSFNQSGSFIMIAESVGKNTLFSRIIDLIATAERSKPSIQKLVDVVSKYFVLSVVIIAIFTFVLWLIFGPSLSYAVMAAVSVFIIACPCALGLATPMSITVGIGKGAESGILIRNAEALEKLEKVTLLAIDKTGTLTEGKPTVSKIYASQSESQELFIKYVAALENKSSHPLAKAILKKAEALGVEHLLDAKEFKLVEGKGIEGVIENQFLRIGSLEWLSENNCEGIAELESLSKHQKPDETLIFASLNNKALGFIAIHDPIKPSTYEAILKIHEMGIKIVMLTGDSHKTASFISETLGIDDFKSRIFPQKKYEFILKTKEKGISVAMAGDGINDAAAITASDVGIAMGTGSDIAIESADITLIKGDLIGIVRAFQLSKAMMKNIRENLFFAFFYNALGIPIAAGILYPFFGILLNPMIAALAMSLSSVSVILNSLRLKFLNLKN
ncbi:heavy metal translocating P-type ATPase [Criblamydia sequanensis]|uniref:Copper-exporting P-type ATPase n=1 Tax=Candidatus Criblamydia sequanensis CRIB-18 TaxID=1437425 RepID=A0A090E3Q8_9BACT|nr:heavy metal translocating P-type ATPase [Criblamydia sequanensis]CDR35184.1 Putative copper-exporting P-type ATPase [Criblamydia sequanensis CRIB-18]